MTNTAFQTQAPIQGRNRRFIIFHFTAVEADEPAEMGTIAVVHLGVIHQNCTSVETDKN